MEWFKIFTVLTFVNLFRYLLIAGGAYWLFWIRRKEWSAKRRIQNREFLPKDLKREFSYSMITSLMFGLFFSIPFFPGIRQYTKVYFILDAHGYAWLVGSFFLLIVFHDAYFYWMHRFIHHPKLFSTVHKVHHQSTNPSPFAAYAFHPLETLLEFAWVIPLLFLLPLNRYVLVAFGFASLIMNVIGHLAFEIYPASWSKHPILKWLNSSTNHNRHHRLYDLNYGLYFTYWDKWMGTLKESVPEAQSTNSA